MDALELERVSAGVGGTEFTAMGELSGVGLGVDSAVTMEVDKSSSPLSLLRMLLRAIRPRWLSSLGGCWSIVAGLSMCEILVVGGLVAMCGSMVAC